MPIRGDEICIDAQPGRGYEDSTRARCGWNECTGREAGMCGGVTVPCALAVLTVRAAVRESGSTAVGWEWLREGDDSTSRANLIVLNRRHKVITRR